MTTHFAFSSYRLTKKTSFLYPAQKTPLIVNVGTFCEMLVSLPKIFSLIVGKLIFRFLWFSLVIII